MGVKIFDINVAHDYDIKISDFHSMHGELRCKLEIQGKGKIMTSINMPYDDVKGEIIEFVNSCEANETYHRIRS